MFVSPSDRPTVSASVRASVTKSAHRTKWASVLAVSRAMLTISVPKQWPDWHIALNWVSVLAVSRAILMIKDPETSRNDHFGHYDSVLAVSRAMLMISVPKRGQVGTSEYIS